MNAISRAYAQQMTLMQGVQAKGKDSDGDNDGSTSSSPVSFGPAVALSLSNVAQNDMAQGDPDGDGH